MHRMSERNHKAAESPFAYAGEGLRRYKSSGDYYAVFKHRGKQIKKVLNTKDKTHARRLLADLRREIQNVMSKEASHVSFETIAQRWLSSIRHTLKPNTIRLYEQCIKRLEPFFRTVTLANITAEHCENWKTRRGEKLAPQSFAHELSTMKRVFGYSIEHGILYRSPARGIKRKRIIATREKFIPTREQFTKLIATIRKPDGKPESKAAAKHGADFVELLAYSGMRKGEAAALKWQDVDFAKNQLTVTGGANRTKNYETRSVPISAELHGLLSRLLAGSQAAPTDNVARIADPKKCLHTVCGKLKLPYFSPHRFRDFFATTCIESGVDIPTIARWLGHKDGGALLMKTYAHLRQEHSQEAMKKITFGANPPKS